MESDRKALDSSDLEGLVTVLLHAVRGPLVSAVAELDELRLETKESTTQELAANAIALIGYASNQLEGAYFLLHREDPILRDNKRVRVTEVARVVLRIVELCRSLGRRREISFTVDSESIQNSSMSVEVDLHLIPLAIWAVIDNAMKYSYSRQCILLTITAAEERLEISIRNRGLAIDPDEVPRYLQLGWRGWKARQVQSGLGWGLSIASQVMEIHGGGLDIRPSGETTLVRLLLPARS